MKFINKRTPAERAENIAAYKQIMVLSLPIIIQHIFSAAVSSADIVMLNSTGQASISAVSLAVQYSNILFGVYYGLGTGLTMLSAQYWGKGDLKAIQKVQGIAMRFSLGISVLFALMAALIPELMMTLFTNDAELTAAIDEGAEEIILESGKYGVIDVTVNRNHRMRPADGFLPRPAAGRSLSTMRRPQGFLSGRLSGVGAKEPLWLPTGDQGRLVTYAPACGCLPHRNPVAHSG